MKQTRSIRKNNRDNVNNYFFEALKQAMTSGGSIVAILPQDKKFII